MTLSPKKVERIPWLHHVLPSLLQARCKRGGVGGGSLNHPAAGLGVCGGLLCAPEAPLTQRGWDLSRHRSYLEVLVLGPDPGSPQGKGCLGPGMAQAEAGCSGSKSWFSCTKTLHRMGKAQRGASPTYQMLISHLFPPFLPENLTNIKLGTNILI